MESHLTQFMVFKVNENFIRSDSYEYVHLNKALIVSVSPERTYGRHKPNTPEGFCDIDFLKYYEVKMITGDVYYMPTNQNEKPY